ncbi:MAG: cell division protein FtsZ [Deltaproteobacteria bacterium]|nr:cell division protein FtsZ [Deltaproteobacteria bacterium]
MGISLDFADQAGYQAQIKVIGIGGGGGNALNTMVTSGMDGVEFVAANTDIQALSQNFAATKLQLGPNLTKGLGAGANPDIGKKSALEDVQRIGEAIQGSDMVFITAGMGGGTGTGAAPIIAQIARDMGALTVAVVTKPFLFEGRKRARFAEQGIQELASVVDTIITIPNQKLLLLAEQDMSLLDAFRRADEVLVNAVRGISDLITRPGLINVDFADVRTIMTGKGRALMGTGYGKGEKRAVEAAEMAIHSPLLDDISVDGSTAILINLTVPPDFRLAEYDAAASVVHEHAHEDANIIAGVLVDPELRDVVKVTVIATGFETTDAQAEEAVQAAPRTTRESYNNLSTRPSLVQAMQRDGMPTPYRSSMPPSQPELPRSMPGYSARPPQPVGGHGMTRDSRFAPHAHDEAALDVPAFLRKSQATHHQD